MFKGLKLNFWQVGIFKASVLSFGAILALTFPDFVRTLSPLLWATMTLGGFYILYLWLKQDKELEILISFFNKFKV